MIIKTVIKATMNQLRQHPFSIVISILIVCCVLSLALFLQFGDIKAVQTWKWIDILGEGGAAVFALLWLFLVLKSRIHFFSSMDGYTR